MGQPEERPLSRPASRKLCAPSHKQARTFGSVSIKGRLFVRARNRGEWLRPRLQNSAHKMSLGGRTAHRLMHAYMYIPNPSLGGVRFVTFDYHYYRRQSRKVNVRFMGVRREGSTFQENDFSNFRKVNMWFVARTYVG